MIVDQAPLPTLSRDGKAVIISQNLLDVSLEDQGNLDGRTEIYNWVIQCLRRKCNSELVGHGSGLGYQRARVTRLLLYKWGFHALYFLGFAALVLLSLCR